MAPPGHRGRQAEVNAPERRRPPDPPADLLASFEARGIDVAFYGGYPGEAGLLVRQAKAWLPDLAFIMSDGVASGDFALIAGDAAEGIPMTMTW